MKEVEGLYSSCSENKGADQLRGSASLFSHMQKSGFLMSRLKLYTQLFTAVKIAIFRRVVLFFLFLFKAPMWVLVSTRVLLS